MLLYVRSILQVKDGRTSFHPQNRSLFTPLHLNVGGEDSEEEETTKMVSRSFVGQACPATLSLQQTIAMVMA